MKVTITIVAATIALAGSAANAQGAAGHAGHAPAPSAAAAAPPPGAGGGRKVAQAARHITRKPGPLPNNAKPPMTMVFNAAEPAMLDRVKAGDKVRFTADKVGGQYTVTRIEPAK